MYLGMYQRLLQVMSGMAAGRRCKTRPPDQDPREPSTRPWLILTALIVCILAARAPGTVGAEDHGNVFEAVPPGMHCGPPSIDRALRGADYDTARVVVDNPKHIFAYKIVNRKNQWAVVYYWLRPSSIQGRFFTWEKMDSLEHAGVLTESTIVYLGAYYMRIKARSIGDLREKAVKERPVIPPKEVLQALLR